jgi:predicted dehydrogenase
MSDKIKVGIWGLGRAGINMHVPEMGRFPEMFEIVAGYDTAEDRREAMNEKCGCKLYSDAESFLNDPEIDLVSIATRSTEHVKHAFQALEAGKYVFLEKPIALNYADALKLVDAEKQYPGKLFFRHNRRFEAPFTHIREIIDTGVLGEIYQVKLHRHSYQRRNDWQTIIDCGGGQLNNWGPHIVEHALRFLDCPVAEIWSDLKKVAAVGDAEDHLKVVLKGENGRVVDLEISGGAAISQPEYVVFGTKGALTCTGENIRMKYIDPEQKLQDIKAEPGNPSLGGGIANGYANLEVLNWIEEDIKVAPKAGCDTYTIWHHLYKAIRKNVPYPITLEQGAEVVRVTEEVKKGTPFEMK